MPDLNSCRHRGMMLAQDSGSARAFVCPYHASAYGLDGALKNIPGEEGFPGFDNLNSIKKAAGRAFSDVSICKRCQRGCA